MDPSPYLPSCIILVLAAASNIVDTKFWLRQIQSVFYVTCLNNKKMYLTWYLSLEQKVKIIIIFCKKDTIVDIVEC